MERIDRLNRKNFALIIISLFAASCIVFFIGLSAGSTNVALSEIINILLGSGSGSEEQIILDIRLPRVLYAALVGGGLSIAGAVFQAVLLNPLAEPYILGISSGGTFGAVLSMLLGFSMWGTQLFAFGGALIVMLLVFLVGKKYGELEPNVLLLSGVMIGAFFSAAILFMMTILNDSLRTAVFWLIGNLSLARKESLPFIFVVVTSISLFLTLNSYKLNLLSLGNDSAKQLGLNTSRLKIVIYLLTSLMIGAIVSVSGIIGFVGLIIPHICRMLFGVDNRIILPASFFIGASYLILADALSRIIIAPSEMPVGAITALMGAPIFIYLLRKRFQTII
ncbi:MAG: iron ABC transporter permease [Ignavibacteria bacterium]|jgi:iron complex transport system permease protein|nr:iron ABC transporter permease [Ignavibacteria bacterium]